MSTLQADTLNNRAGTKTVPVDTVIDGSAKAWVNFNGTGTVAIRASFNVSSITDNGAGDYTVNFTNALPDVNYANFVTCATNNGNVLMAYESTTTAKTTSALRVFVTATGSGIDSAGMNVVVFR